MRRPRKTVEQLTLLIKQRAAMVGPWPPRMTMLLYPVNDTWDVTVSAGKTPQEEDFRISVLWIATQMQLEFDLWPRTGSSER